MSISQSKADPDVYIQNPFPKKNTRQGYHAKIFGRGRKIINCVTEDRLL